MKERGYGGAGGRNIQEAISSSVCTRQPLPTPFPRCSLLLSPLIRFFKRVNGGTIKCETAGDVMLLLKSSDRMQNDLDRLEELVRGV